MGKHTETFDGIAIHGSKDFIAEMKEALTLLQYSPSFQEVLPFLTKIDAADILSPNADAEMHRYDGNKPTYNHSSISLTSAIYMAAPSFASASRWACRRR